MATPFTELASLPAASRSASVGTRPESVTMPFARFTFTLVTVERRRSPASFACNASSIFPGSSRALFVLRLRGCAVLQPAPPRTATTDASAAASATRVVPLLPLQFLPVFIDRPLGPERVRSGLVRSFAKGAPRRRRVGHQPTVQSAQRSSSRNPFGTDDSFGPRGAAVPSESLRTNRLDVFSARRAIRGSLGMESHGFVCVETI